MTNKFKKGKCVLCGDITTISNNEGWWEYEHCSDCIDNIDDETYLKEVNKRKK